MGKEKFEEIINDPDYLFEIPDNVIRDSSLTISELRIYMLINALKKTNTKKSEWPNDDWMAKKCHIGKDSLIYYRNLLIEKGYIK